MYVVVFSHVILQFHENKSQMWYSSMQIFKNMNLVYSLACGLVCVFTFFSLKSLGQFMTYLTSMEKARKDYVYRHLSFLISVSPRRAGVFSRDFTKNLAHRAGLIPGL